MNKATVNQLTALHRSVAESMLNALTQADTAADLLNEYGDDLPPAVRSFLNRSRTVNPALLTAATKFLKDNNISCDVADDENISELQQRLNGRQKKSISDINFQ